MPKMTAQQATVAYPGKHEFVDRPHGARCKHCLWEPKPDERPRLCTDRREAPAR